MEDALDVIFDEDVPPGITAVAAKVNIVWPPDLPFANPTGFCKPNRFPVNHRM